MSAYCADTIPVFAGPSLAGWDASPPFLRLPAAGVGDVLRLAGGPPCTVVLIDGVFGARLAVWHKEILVLLSLGFRVIGAASMGALRSAELAPLGMIGTGGIFRAYANGRITGDDEVAVLHAPDAIGGHPLTLAQVNVRATLGAAVRARRLPVGAARDVRTASAAIHYRDRDWAAVGAAAQDPGFAVWAAANTVDIKAADARAALALALRLAPLSPPVHPSPPQTQFLDRLRRQLAAG